MMEFLNFISQDGSHFWGFIVVLVLVMAFMEETIKHICHAIGRIK